MLEPSVRLLPDHRFQDQRKIPGERLAGLCGVPSQGQASSDTVCLVTILNPLKLEAMRSLGAEVRDTKRPGGAASHGNAGTKARDSRS